MNKEQGTITLRLMGVLATMTVQVHTNLISCPWIIWAKCPSLVSWITSITNTRSSNLWEYIQSSMILIQEHISISVTLRFNHKSSSTTFIPGVGETSHYVSYRPALPQLSLGWNFIAKVSATNVLNCTPKYKVNWDNFYIKT